VGNKAPVGISLRVCTFVDFHRCFSQGPSGATAATVKPRAKESLVKASVARPLEAVPRPPPSRHAIHRQQAVQNPPFTQVCVSSFSLRVDTSRQQQQLEGLYCWHSIAGKCIEPNCMFCFFCVIRLGVCHSTSCVNPGYNSSQTINIFRKLSFNLSCSSIPFTKHIVALANILPLLLVPLSSVT